jgi:hypothetical protein
VDLPVRTDTVASSMLAYNRSPRHRARAASPDGWLTCTLTTRPVFVAEPASQRIHRPDLVVDSIRLDTQTLRVGAKMEVQVYIHNAGSRATPANVPVTLTLNGRELARSTSGAIAQDGTSAVSMAVSRVPRWTQGTGLLATSVNPDQRFVELNMENNTAYTAVTILPPNR